MRDKRLARLGEVSFRDFRALLLRCTANWLDNQGLTRQDLNELREAVIDGERLVQMHFGFQHIQESLNTGFIPAGLTGPHDSNVIHSPETDASEPFPTPAAREHVIDHDGRTENGIGEYHTQEQGSRLRDRNQTIGQHTPESSKKHMNGALDDHGTTLQGGDELLAAGSEFKPLFDREPALTEDHLTWQPSNNDSPEHSNKKSGHLTGTFPNISDSPHQADLQPSLILKNQTAPFTDLNDKEGKSSLSSSCNRSQPLENKESFSAVGGLKDLARFLNTNEPDVHTSGRDSGRSTRIKANRAAIPQSRIKQGHDMELKAKQDETLLGMSETPGSRDSLMKPATVRSPHPLPDDQRKETTGDAETSFFNRDDQRSNPAGMSETDLDHLLELLAREINRDYKRFYGSS